MWVLPLGGTVDSHPLSGEAVAVSRQRMNGEELRICTSPLCSLLWELWKQPSKRALSWREVQVPEVGPVFSTNLW